MYWKWHQNRTMRAGRLVSLLLLLQARGRMTAAELAEELEVSVRTVMRDIDELSGAGVPVHSRRGARGGFQLIDGYRTDLAGPGSWQPADRRPGRARRATVRVTPEGRRLAAVLGRLQPLRVRRGVEPDEHGRFEATFRLLSIDGATHEVLSLGPEIEVLEPAALRQRVAANIQAAAALYETAHDP
jgi:predicted DNA-binding transcriptional regulator YafY